MKKISILPFLILLLFALQSQAQKEVYISNTTDFIKAIGPNRTLVLKSGSYHLSDIEGNSDNAFVHLEEGYDGYEVKILGVNDLTIKSADPKNKAELITRPRYGDVLVFDNCSGIVLENLIAGHGPEKGYCEGGVFNFNDCKDIRIKGSVLYGSGIEGITGNNINGLKVSGTTIKECTYGIMTLMNSTKIDFSDCLFKGNEEFALITLDEVSNIKYRGCTFKDNNTGDFWGYVFKMEGCEEVKVLGCSFINNHTEFLANDKGSIKFKKCDFNDNEFRQRKYE